MVTRQFKGKYHCWHCYKKGSILGPSSVWKLMHVGDIDYHEYDKANLRYRNLNANNVQAGWYQNTEGRSMLIGHRQVILESGVDDYLDRVRLYGYDETGWTLLVDIDFDVVHGKGAGTFTDDMYVDISDYTQIHSLWQTQVLNVHGLEWLAPEILVR